MAAESEDALLARLRRRIPGFGRGLVLGSGDDCAVFRPARGEDLLFTTDFTIEGVHFRRDAETPESVGWRTLARGLSDIAAMGGEPRFCLLSLALAPWTDGRWIDAFCRGFFALARRARVTLAGGDVSHGERLAADIVVCGAVPRGKALRRDGARVGDGVYVSGRLGWAARGRERLVGRPERPPRPGGPPHRPEPRIGLGRFLRETVRAHACMDLSDGLALDLRRLCLASGCAAEIDRVPAFPGATLEQTLSGGEDYELLFTAGARAMVPASFGRLPLTRIGSIVKGRAGAVLYQGRALAPVGYDHLVVRP